MHRCALDTLLKINTQTKVFLRPDAWPLKCKPEQEIYRRFFLRKMKGKSGIEEVLKWFYFLPTECTISLIVRWDNYIAQFSVVIWLKGFSCDILDFQSNFCSFASRKLCFLVLKILSALENLIGFERWENFDPVVDESDHQPGEWPWGVVGKSCYGNGTRPGLSAIIATFINCLKLPSQM